MKRAAALVAVLCAAIFGALVLNLSFTILLIAGGALIVTALLRAMWSSERAYRRNEQVREAHLAREREHANARRRERGD
jgi:predicted membrane protein